MGGGGGGGGGGCRGGGGGGRGGRCGASRVMGIVLAANVEGSRAAASVLNSETGESRPRKKGCYGKGSVQGNLVRNIELVTPVKL